MKYRRRAVVLWMTFAFVTWNVVFDRGVCDAALEFTREQIVRYQNTAALASIDTAFRPRVNRAALTASLYSVLVLVCGAVVLALAGASRDVSRGTKVPRDENGSRPPSTLSAGL